MTIVMETVVVTKHGLPCRCCSHTGSTAEAGERRPGVLDDAQEEARPMSPVCAVREIC